MSTTSPPTALKAEPGDSRWLREAFSRVQENLAAEMQLAANSISHAGTMGSVNEDHWIRLLRGYLPYRYEVDTGVVIDSLGNRSDQIDIVVFDRHFTPTLLDQNKHRYIPAEAVYAVFECKPTINKGMIEYAQKKAASVRRMTRTSAPIIHIGGISSPKEPFPIVGGLLAPAVEWGDGFGSAFRSNLSSQLEDRLDCGVALSHGCFDIHEGGSLKVVTEPGALMYFLFRLLARLQSLGTVPAVDWNAYSRIITL